MNEYSKKILNAIKNYEPVKDYHQNLKVTGKNPRELTIKAEWKDIGKLKISPFSLSDFWALRDWWIRSLNYKTKCLFPLFPTDERLDRTIANHYKNHQTHRDIIFNAWLLKEGYLNEDFDNEIIGHFFLNRCETRPEPGLGVADKFQGKKLGTFFIVLLIYIAKFLGKKLLYISTDIDNKISFNLYKKLGFKHIKNTPIKIPVVGYSSIICELELDLEKY